MFLLGEYIQNGDQSGEVTSTKEQLSMKKKKTNKKKKKKKKKNCQTERKRRERKADTNGPPAK